MKKKALAVIALAVLSMSTITACGNKNEDTGVVINAGDKGYDTSKNDVITSEGKSETVESQEQEESKQVVNTEVSEDKFSLYGTWVSVDGNIFEFTPAGYFNGYMLDEQRNVNGTYETDENTYITVSETNRYEYIETTLEDGTVTTEQNPLDDVTFEFKITSKSVGDDAATNSFTYLMTLEYNDKEIELRKDMDLESNYDTTYYDYETAVETEVEETEVVVSDQTTVSTSEVESTQQ
jgi:hypothetical protein